MDSTAVLERNKKALELLKAVPKDKLCQQGPSGAVREALKGLELPGPSLLQRMCKVAAAGVELEVPTSTKIGEVSAALPFHLDHVLAKTPDEIAHMLRDGKTSKLGTRKPAKLVQRSHQIFGTKRKGKFSLSAREVRAESAKSAGRARDHALKDGGPEFRVAPPSIPQEHLSLSKRLAQEGVKHSVDSRRQYHDELGNWFEETCFYVVDVKPLGKFGLPNGRPEKSNRC